MKKKSVNRIVEKRLFVDGITGQLFELELLVKARQKKTVPKDADVLKSRRNVQINARLLNDLYCMLSSAEFRHFNLLVSKLKTQFNIVFVGNRRPHTKETLTNLLGFQSVNYTNKLIRRFIELGLASWTYCPESGHSGKVLILNPYYAYRYIKINEGIYKLFDNERCLF